VLAGRAESAAPAIEVLTSKGQLQKPTLQQIPGGQAWRLSFQVDTGDEKVIELHARLLDADQPVSETWAYRWTA